MSSESSHANRGLFRYDSSPGLRVLISLACLVLLLAGLKIAAPVLVPICLGVLLSVISLPLLSWLQRRRVPHLISVFLTLGVNLSVFGFLLFLGIRLFRAFWSQLARHVEALRGMLERSAAWLEDKGVDGAVDLVSTHFDWPQVFRAISEHDMIQQGLRQFGFSFVGTVTTSLSTFLIILLVMIFTLLEASHFHARLTAVTQAGGPDLSKLLQTGEDVQKYIAIKSLMSLINGLVVLIICTLAKVEYAVLWAIVTFFFNFIPAIGSITASVPPILIALAQHGFWTAFVVLAGFIITDQILGNFVEPTLMGRRFGVSTLVIFTSVVFWGWLWGPIGMFMAVPIIMLIKMLLDNTDEWRWLSAAISKKSVRKDEVLVGDQVIEESEWLGGGAATESPDSRQNS